MITFVIVIIHVVVHRGFNLLKAYTVMEVDGILHVAEKAFLRSVIPTVAAARHGTPQAAVFYYLYEFTAGVMASLVAVNQRLSLQRTPMLLEKAAHRFQYEVYLHGFAQRVGEDLFCEGVQNGGEVSELALIGYVGDVGQQHHPRAIAFKLAVEKVLRASIRFHGLGHTSIRVGLADRAAQFVLLHQAADLFKIHHHWRTAVKQAHGNTTRAFRIAAAAVSFQDQPKVLLIPFFQRGSKLGRFFPRIEPGTGHAGAAAHLRDGQRISRLTENSVDNAEGGRRFIHENISYLRESLIEEIFFKNSTS